MNRSDMLIRSIGETTKVCRILLASYILAVSYAALTAASTTDRQLILNEGARLPGLQVTVPMQEFLIVSPLIISALFFYLLLFVHRLKSLINIVREETSFDDKILPPWLMTLWEDPMEGGMGKIQRASASFILWWIFPSIIFFFTVQFLKINHTPLTYMVGVAPLFSGVISLSSWASYKGSSIVSLLRRSWIAKLLSVLIVILEVILLFYLIPGARDGKILALDLSYQTLVSSKQLESGYAGFFAEAQLVGAALDFTQFQRADLKGADLRAAHMAWAKFDSANLRNANLTKAKGTNVHFIGADLRGATLTKTEFPNASFIEAKLQKAIFLGATLTHSDFTDAVLDSADIRNSILVGAWLDGISAIKAQFDGADLRNASLRHANLTAATFNSFSDRITDLRGADLTEAIMENAFLQGVIASDAIMNRVNLRRAQLSEAKLIGTRLISADLRGANLTRANLTAAKLQRARFHGSKLRGTQFQYANLTGAIFGDSTFIYNASFATFSDLGDAFFSNAILDEADFRFVKNLKVGQICNARSAVGLLARDSFLQELRLQCPGILIPD